MKRLAGETNIADVLTQADTDYIIQQAIDFYRYNIIPDRHPDNR